MTKSSGRDHADDLAVPATDPTELSGNAEVSPTSEITATTSADPGHSPSDERPAGDARPRGGAKPTVAGSVAGSTWVALSIGAVILILLLVFILQNQESVKLQMFAWQWNFPIGVGMLIAAIAGALVMASVGAVRILQLRRQINHPADGKTRRKGRGRNR